MHFLLKIGIFHCYVGLPKGYLLSRDFDLISDFFNRRSFDVIPGLKSKHSSKRRLGILMVVVVVVVVASVASAFAAAADDDDDDDDDDSGSSSSQFSKNNSSGVCRLCSQDAGTRFQDSQRLGSWVTWGRPSSLI